MADLLQNPRHPAPTWKQWNTPALKQIVIQANANVVALEQGKPLFLPVTLADYHRNALAGHTKSG